MKHFDVIVCHYRVQIQEVEEPHKTVHVRARVDGENYVYRITKYSGHKLHRTWMERGYTQAYYHAKESGSYVVFVRSDAPGQPDKIPSA